MNLTHKTKENPNQEYSLTTSIFEYFLGGSTVTNGSVNFENPSLSEDVSSLKKIDFHKLENDRPTYFLNNF
jgi:hypothetical protein